MEQKLVCTIVEIAVGLGLIICVNFAIKRLLKYIRRRFLAHPGHWKEQLDYIVYSPIRMILWILGATFVLDILGRYFGFTISWNYLKPGRDAVIALCLGWMVFRWKSTVQQSLLEHGRWGHKKIEPGIVQIIGRLASICIFVLTALILLQVLGLDIVPLMAFGGIGAAAIGFAGKDVIANFFGGFMLHITRPFTIGDVILLSDKNVEGTVEEIGWYLTSIRDKHKRPIYLPNALFSTAMVVNWSRMSHRRIEETIKVRYTDFAKLPALVESIRSLIRAHPRVDTDIPVLVFFHHFAEFSLEIYIEAFTLATQMEEYLAVKQEILMQVQEHVQLLGAEMPFPTATVEVRNERLS